MHFQYLLRDGLNQKLSSEILQYVIYSRMVAVEFSALPLHHSGPKKGRAPGSVNSCTFARAESSAASCNSANERAFGAPVCSVQGVW